MLHAPASALVLIAAMLAAPLLAASGDERPPAPVQLFEDDILPIVTARCAGCHGAKKREAGLRLDSATGVLAGSDNGPVVVAGQPEASQLLERVTATSQDERMPPEGAPLSEFEVNRIRLWVEQGAVAPVDEAARQSSDHWAFQPVTRPPLPGVRDSAWVRTPIDYFILARLESKGLQPSQAADRPTLIRRLSLDLRGLPPTPDETARFVNDDRPDAYEQLVERMLASPAFGERWGRHWLDLARYADSNGYTRDFGRQMWKYRDWVIDAINRDLSFRQFTIEQIAGDLLPAARLDQKIATGFHRNTLINEEGGTDKEQFRVDAVADRVATTGSVFLGLTLGCARCHTHKYDPISQREYYEVFALLNDSDEPTIDAPAPHELQLLEQRDALRAKVKRLQAELASREAEVAQQQAEWELTITPEERARLPGPVQASLDKEVAERTDEQKKLVRDLYMKSEHAKKAFPIYAEIGKLRSSEPKVPTAMVMRARSQPRETFVHRRGNFLDHGRQVQPGVPRVLPPLKSQQAETPRAATRLDFAEWLVDADNPLTSRVVINRYWQRLFGTGIVSTENDFGTQGAAPSHPELLDWLADEFIRRDWSTKSMLRLLVLSATYRQSSHVRQDLTEADPANRWLGRQNRQRLEAEIIRDASLVASGLLTRHIGGPSVFPPQVEGVFEFTQDPKPWKTETGSDRYRRGMYTHFWRSSPYPTLMVFDFPNSNVTCTRRVRSNTPLQALTLANDPTFVEAARELAQQIRRQPSSDDRSRIQFAFQRSLGRQPQAAELERMLAYLAQQRLAFADDSKAAAAFAPDEDASGQVEWAAWFCVARVLMNLDEFVTRE